MAKIFQGSSGWVSVTDDTASKYISVVDGNYWMREFTALLYLGQFNHSNVVPLKSYGTVYRRIHGKQEIRLFTEMKFPAYEQTLEDVLNKPITDQMIFQWMIDICAAVSLCHKCGIMHRDIKPANIMIDKGRAILIDYTHCYKQVNGNKFLDNNVVTFTHRAKEVYEFQERKINSYNEKIDIWSIGIILIELCIGKPFFSFIGKKDEDMRNLFIKDEKYYMSIIKNILTNHMNHKLQNKYLYYWLITLLLKQNINERPSAENILDVFIVNSRAIKIPVEIPVMLTKKEIDYGLQCVNGFKIPNELIIVVPEYRVKLLDNCIKLWKDIYAVYKIIEVGYVIDWLTYTINTGFTNYTNWRLVVLASIVLINTLICDYAIDIRTLTYDMDQIFRFNIKLKEIELFTIEFFKQYAMEIVVFNAMVDMTKIKKETVMSKPYVKTPKRKNTSPWLNIMENQVII